MMRVELVLGFVLGVTAALAAPLLLRLTRHAYRSARGRVRTDRGDSSSKVAAAAPAAATSRSSGDVYDAADHAYLNARVDSLWMNMGLWEDNAGEHGEVSESPFIRACTALARRHGELAQLTPLSRVLDCGFGCGDSLLLWTRHFGVPSSSITGITVAPGQCELAGKRCQAHLARAQAVRDASAERNGVPPPSDGPQLYAGNAGDLDLLLGDNASTKNTSVVTFDAAIAVDSAYHFSTRETFLKGAHKRLRPQRGSLVYSDLLLARPSRSAYSTFERLALRLLRTFAGVPNDFLTRDECEAVLRRHGFDRVELHDISDRVFSPLADFLTARGSGTGSAAQLGLTSALNESKASQFSMFANILRWWDGRGGDSTKRRLAFTIVVARRAST